MKNFLNDKILVALFETKQKMTKRLPRSSNNFLRNLHGQMADSYENSILQIFCKIDEIL